MLQLITEFITYTVFRLSPNTTLGKTVNFFIYDSIKILFLLFIFISLIGILRSYVPEYKIKKWISNKHTFLGHLFAAIFGALTPFCSCSSIPIFLGFLEARIPLGLAFTFLITSPLINEYLVVLMLGYFGLKITIIYIINGLILGIIAGMLLGKLNLEKHLEPDLLNKSKEEEIDGYYYKFSDRVHYGIGEGVAIIKKIWKWVLFGVAFGAIIHNLIPQSAIELVLGKLGASAVPIAAILGVPMYGSCASIVPIAVALFNKGLPLGTALTFMMGVSALSLPEAIILRRAMNIKLIGIFFGVVTLGIIFTGYLINYLILFS